MDSFIDVFIKGVTPQRQAYIIKSTVQLYNAFDTFRPYTWKLFDNGRIVMVYLKTKVTRIEIIGTVK